MAKNPINMFEQHVEKAVVALVVGLFIYVCATFGVRSPNVVELSGETVAPNRIDQKVKEMADRVIQRVRGARHDDIEVEDYPSEQAKLVQGPYTVAELPLAFPEAGYFGPPVPVVRGPQAPGQLTLASIVAPDRPMVNAGRLSALIAPRILHFGDVLTEVEEDLMFHDGAKDIAWVTVAARFDIRKQDQEFLRNDYKTSKFKLRLANVALQRQLQSEDGQWGQWENVVGFAEYKMPPAPQLSLVDQGAAGFTVPENERAQLLEWRNMLDEFADEIARPPLPPAEYGRDADPPQLALKKLALLYPDQYKYREAKSDKKTSPSKLAKQLMAEAQTLKDADQLDDALAVLDKIIKNKRISKKFRKDAQELRREIKAMIRDKERELIIERGQEGDEPEEEPQTEDVFYAHDVSAIPDGVYRYRMRLEVYNEYATMADKLKDPKDASTVIMYSDWSEPSEPIEVPLVEKIFVTSADPQKKEARFDINKWVKGAWVNAAFKVSVGEEIGGKRTVSHAGLRGRIEVDFSTGMKLTEVVGDFEYSYVTAKGEPNKELTEVVRCELTDGSETEFVVLASKMDPARKEIREEMKQVRKGKKPKSEPKQDEAAPAAGGGRDARSGGVSRGGG